LSIATFLVVTSTSGPGNFFFSEEEVAAMANRLLDVAAHILSKLTFYFFLYFSWPITVLSGHTTSSTSSQSHLCENEGNQISHMLV